MAFSNSLVYNSNPVSGGVFIPSITPNISNAPGTQLNNTSWALMGGCYDATGYEQYITYGNFFSAANTTFSLTNPSGSLIPSNYFFDDFRITPLALNVTASNTICLGSSKTLTTSLICGLPNGVTPTFSWSPSIGLSTTTGTSTVASPNANTIYTITATIPPVNSDASPCTITNTVLVTIAQATIAITSNSNTICNGIVNYTATPNPAGSYTYSWTVKDAATGTIVPTPNYTITAGSTNTPSINFGNIGQSVNICVTATNSLGCQFSQCYYMAGCCPTATNIIKYTNTTYSTTVVVPAAAGSSTITYGGTITVNSGGNVIISSKDVWLEPNTKFVLNGTGKITFSGDYVHACTDMWDGIYVNNTSTVTITNSRVEDAKRVIIDSLGGASVSVLSSYLNKNNMGVVFKAAKTSTSAVSIKNTLFTCATISTAGALPKIPTAVNLTNAATLGAFPTTFMLPPYNTQKSFCGIYTSDASHTGKTNTALVIGGATNEENVFDKMQYGAYFVRSRTTLQNNVFQNIKSSIAPISGGAFNTGVLAVGPLFGSGGPYYTLVGGTNVNFKNTFKDNDNGFINYSQYLVSVQYNRFENQGTGVFITANNNRSTVNVGFNKFVNNKIGINFDYNSNIDANISENWMDNTSVQGTYADNFAIRCTEPVPTTNPATNAKYYIYNNYINGYYNGITTKLTFQSTITDNEVHMRPDNTNVWPAHFHSGIFIEATNDNLVTKNLVDMPSSNPLQWWHYGIFTAGSTTPKIKCNSTNYVGVGIIANGPNLTTPGDGINGNSMSNALYGFWLNASGEIGDQYTTNTSTSADNSWTNCGNETFANSNCNSVNAKFYTRAAAPYNITNATNITPSFPLTGIVAANIASGACYNSVPTPTLNLKLGGNGAKKLLMQNADEIANGSIVFTENNASLKQIARKQLYSNLALQQIDQNVSPDINTFANNCKQNSLNQFFLVDSLINTGDSSKLNVANAINNSINTTNNDVDATQQQFNALYINFLKNNRKAKASDVVNFENIAWLCPNINGHAVYQARSVLFNITKQQYVNVCEKGDPNSSKRIANSIIAGSDAAVKLYPNPTNGSITLQANEDVNYNLSVYNLLGEKVFESSISNKQTINLSNLSSATYIVHIHNNGNLIKTERISIIH
jgi:hypothetical protein